MEHTTAASVLNLLWPSRCTIVASPPLRPPSESPEAPPQRASSPEDSCVRRLRSFSPESTWLELGPNTTLDAELLRVSPTELGGLVVTGNPKEQTDPRLLDIISSAGFSAPSLPRPPAAANAKADTNHKDIGYIWCGQTKDIRQLPLLLIWGDTTAGLLAAVTSTTTDLLKSVSPPLLFPTHPIEAVVRPRPGLRSGFEDLPPHAVELLSLRCGSDIYNQVSRTWDPQALDIVELVSDSAGARQSALLNGRAVGLVDADRSALLWLLAANTMLGKWTSLEDACDRMKRPGRCQVLKARLTELRKDANGKLFIEERFDEKRQSVVFRLNAKIISHRT